jgi:GNAT superfamily N-acetyltransferase
MICELTYDEIPLALTALRELRPHVAELQAHIAEQVQHGYRLAAAMSDAEPAGAVCVAGFRIDRNLAWGRHLYVDDLITRTDFRGQGHGRRMMDWLVEEARREGCPQLHLDSGTGPARHDAHALYHASRLHITSHHFSIGVSHGEAP